MRVICTLPNASLSINGVSFMAHKLGVISEEVDQDVGDAFLSIDGYLDADAVKAKAIAYAAAPLPLSDLLPVGAIAHDAALHSDDGAAAAGADAAAAVDAAAAAAAAAGADAAASDKAPAVATKKVVSQKKQ